MDYRLLLEDEKFQEAIKYIHEKFSETETPKSTPEENGTIFLDNNKIPWDARIHSSNKKFTKNGSWVKRRGVPQDIYDKVMTEIKTPVPYEETPSEKELNAGVIALALGRNSITSEQIIEACHTLNKKGIEEVFNDPACFVEFVELLNLEI